MLHYCHLTDWVRPVEQYFYSHCLILQYERCTIDGNIQGKAWDSEETLKLLDFNVFFRLCSRTIQSRYKCISTQWINSNDSVITAIDSYRLLYV